MAAELALCSRYSSRASIIITLATYCCVLSNSPYIQPSFSSWISRVMMSPSSKLRRVGLVPAMWGKMVLTRDLLLRLRPDDCDTEWDRGNSPMLPCSGDRIGITEIKLHVFEAGHPLKTIFSELLSHFSVRRFNPPYLSCGLWRWWVVIWALGWTCWQVDWSVPLEVVLEEAPGSPGSSD